MTAAAPIMAKPASGDLFGHPRGLSVLFATEMWERFSYYGMASLLALYLVKYLLLPGHVETIIGYAAVKGAMERVFGPLAPQPFAAQLIGLYTGLAYFTPILGGYIADRYVGQRITAVIGALLMAAGHFLMAFESMLFFALGLLILGMGAFKPNVSTQVGSLYGPEDHRRVRAYSIYYLGINIGAFLAPLVCGTLGEAYSPHYGFTAAGVGMLVATAIYLHGMRWLPPDELHRERADAHLAALAHAPLKANERHAVVGLLCIFALVAFFWAAYDQQNITLPLWANDFTNRTVTLGSWTREIPATWFPALNPLMIFILTPIVIKAWALLARFGHEPSDVAKMAFAFFCLALANLVLAAGALANSGAAEKASPLWLVGYFFVGTVGELHLAPVGLALISRLAPARMLSLMMGLWLAATFPGDVLGGWLGGFWSSMSKPHFFLMLAAITAVAGAAIFAISPILKRAFEE
jgi:proton-dependent oligopeptide transporter, POT family